MDKPGLIMQCPSCDGTGIYVGITEREGAGVICKECNGTGATSLKYTVFTGKQLHKGIKRVYKQSYGLILKPTAITRRGVEVDMTKEGVSYEEFQRGIMPQHIKAFVCPSEVEPVSKEFKQECKHRGCGVDTDLMCFTNKLECWKRLEKETNHG